MKRLEALAVLSSWNLGKWLHVGSLQGFLGRKAKVLKAKSGFSQGLGRRQGSSGTRKYSLLNWRHSKPNSADGRETL